MTKGRKSKPVRNGKRQEAPKPIFITKGNFPGEVNLSWDAVSGATSYILQISRGRRGKWKHVDIITEPFYMLTGLRNGSHFFFRVAAVFRNGQGPWSEPFARTVKEKF